MQGNSTPIFFIFLRQQGTPVSRPQSARLPTGDRTLQDYNLDQREGTPMVNYPFVVAGAVGFLYVLIWAVYRLARWWQYRQYRDMHRKELCVAH
jgi:hypothetical protein